MDYQCFISMSAISKGSYSYGHFKFHTFPYLFNTKNVQFHTKICIWYAYFKHIPGSFGKSPSIFIFNFNQFQLNCSSNCMKKYSLEYQSLAHSKKFPQNSRKSILFHTATLNFILFMTLKNRRLNSLLFQIFHTEYEPWSAIKSY